MCTEPFPKFTLILRKYSFKELINFCKNIFSPNFFYRFGKILTGL